MKVTRRQVIHALRTEPLKSGNWAHSVRFVTQDCEVCAVGAVLRRFTKKHIHTLDFADLAFLNCRWQYAKDDGLDTALEDKNYWGALSIYFEQIAYRSKITSRTREKLVNFVKAHFPKELKLETRPRRECIPGD